MGFPSRSGRGRRRRTLASAAAATAGTLLVWLVITAIPASAASSCATSTSVVANDTLDVSIGADDKVALQVGAGPAYELSVNGAAFAACGGAPTTANVQWVNVLGSDAGAETLTLFAPAAMAGENVTVDLGNGNDTLLLEYGALAAPATADPGGPDAIALGGSAGGGLVGDMNDDDTADLRIDNAETITVDAGATNDLIDAGGGIGSGRSTIAAVAPPPEFTSDDIPAAPNPFPANLNILGGAGDDLLVSGNGNDNFQGGPGEDTVDYEYAAGPVVVDLTAATGTGMGSDTLADVQDAIGSDFADTLTGNSLDNELYGGDGNDTISGEGGDDFEFGEDGNDTMIEGTAANGADIIYGGFGAETYPPGDTVDYSGRTNAVNLSINGIADDGEGACTPVVSSTCEGDYIGHGIDTVVGGSGNDTLSGDSSSETFVGGPGDDAIDGRGGENTADYTDAPAGITADMGAGTVTGDGNDTIENVQDIVGSAFDDTFVDCVRAADCLNGNGPYNEYYGGDGDDTFDQGTSPSEDSDFMEGDAGVDTVDYSARTNNLVVDLHGAGGPCAPGRDEQPSPSPTVDVAGAASIMVGGIGEAGEYDDFNNDVENALGGSGDDLICGNQSNNLIVGNSGNDTLLGFEGNDLFPAGSAPDGADSICGGDGTDTVDYSQRTGAVFVDLSGGGNQGEVGEGDNLSCSMVVVVAQVGAPGGDLENALTGSGNDTVFGNDDANMLDAGPGKDVVSGYFGNDQMFGRGGKDTVTYLGNTDGAGVFVNLNQGTGGGGWAGLDRVKGFENLIGTAFADTLIGNGKANKITGLAGNDILKGLAGNDTLNGSAGNDTLNGGPGKDKCNGGPGHDKFFSC
jgi:Ca2+-binding RTX toxin-like protein